MFAYLSHTYIYIYIYIYIYTYIYVYTHTVITVSFFIIKRNDIYFYFDLFFSFMVISLICMGQLRILFLFLYLIFLLKLDHGQKYLSVFIWHKKVQFLPPCLTFIIPYRLIIVLKISQMLLYDKFLLIFMPFKSVLIKRTSETFDKNVPYICISFSKILLGSFEIFCLPIIVIAPTLN